MALLNAIPLKCIDHLYSVVVDFNTLNFGFVFPAFVVSLKRCHKLDCDKANYKSISNYIF